MRDRHIHIGMYILEALLFLACIVGMVFFFLHRQCPLDILFLVLWGVALLVLVPLLIRGERRLHREEELSAFLNSDEYEERVKWKN